MIRNHKSPNEHWLLLEYKAAEWRPLLGPGRHSTAGFLLAWSRCLIMQEVIHVLQRQQKAAIMCSSGGAQTYIANL